MSRKTKKTATRSGGTGPLEAHPYLESKIFKGYFPGFLLIRWPRLVFLFFFLYLFIQLSINTHFFHRNIQTHPGREEGLAASMSIGTLCRVCVEAKNILGVWGSIGNICPLMSRVTGHQGENSHSLDKVKLARQFLVGLEILVIAVSIHWMTWLCGELAS